jgi:hypothetical protein
MYARLARAFSRSRLPAPATVVDPQFAVCLRYVQQRLRQRGATRLAGKLAQQPDWFGGEPEPLVRLTLDHEDVHALMAALGDAAPAHARTWGVGR